MAQQLCDQNLIMVERNHDRWIGTELYAVLGTLALERKLPLLAWRHFRDGIKNALEMPSSLYAVEGVLGFAKVCETQSRFKQAAMYAFFILNHSATPHYIKEQANALVDKIKEQGVSLNLSSIGSETQSWTIEGTLNVAYDPFEANRYS